MSAIDTRIHAITPAALRTDRLREAMALAGMDELELAKALGYQSSQPVVYWLTGVHEPTVWNLRQMCKVLIVSADWLLGLEE